MAHNVIKHIHINIILNYQNRKYLQKWDLNIRHFEFQPIFKIFRNNSTVNTKKNLNKSGRYSFY